MIEKVVCKYRDPHPHSYMPDFCDIAGDVRQSHPYCLNKDPCPNIKLYENLNRKCD